MPQECAGSLSNVINVHYPKLSKHRGHNRRIRTHSLTHSAVPLAWPRHSDVDFAFLHLLLFLLFLLLLVALRDGFWP